MSYKTQMHGGGESSSDIVPTKQPNEDLGRSQEVAEGRSLAKENAGQSNSCRTLSRESEPSGLDRVRQAAREDGPPYSDVRYFAIIQGGNRVR